MCSILPFEPPSKLPPNILNRLAKILIDSGRLSNFQQRLAFLGASGLSELEQYLPLDETTHTFVYALIRECSKAGNLQDGQLAYFNLLDHSLQFVEGYPEEHGFLSNLRQGIAPSTIRPFKITPPTKDFVGRNAILKRSTTALRQSRPVILSGMGGIGKTQIARKIALAVSADFPDFAFEFDLQPDNSPVSSNDLIGSLLLRFHNNKVILPETLSERVFSLGSLLEGKHGVLLLDNVLSREQIQPLEKIWHGWAVVITSRVMFDMEDSINEEVPALTLHECQKLLKKRLALKQRYENAESLVLLAKGCRCHPLAIVIASSFLGIYTNWSIRQYLNRVEKQPLDGFIPEANEYQNLATILGISIEQLYQSDPSTSDLLHLLALIPETFDSELASFTWGITRMGRIPTIHPLSESITQKSLDRLIRLNLLQVFPTSSDVQIARYRLHDFFIDYILRFSSFSPSSQRREIAIRCHAIIVLSRARKSCVMYLDGKHQLALKQFDEIWNHLYIAWQRLSTKNDPLAQFFTNRFSKVLWHLLEVRVSTSDLLSFYSLSLNAARSCQDRANEAFYLGSLGNVYSNLGDSFMAMDYYKQALVISLEVQDKWEESRTLGHMGIIYDDWGKTNDAIACFEQALEIAQNINAKELIGAQLNSLGGISYSLGDIDKAIDHYQKAYLLFQDMGDQNNVGGVLNNLGTINRQRGQIYLSIDYFEKALSIHQEIGDKRGESIALTNLGISYIETNEFDKAINYLQDSREISIQIIDKAGEASALSNISGIYVKLGELHKAIDNYKISLKLCQSIGYRRGEILNLGNIGDCYADLKDFNFAIDFYNQAIAISRDIDDKHNEGIWSWNLALVYIYLGKQEKAIPYAVIAHTLFEETKHPDYAKVRAHLKEWGVEV